MDFITSRDLNHWDCNSLSWYQGQGVYGHCLSVLGPNTGLLWGSKARGLFQGPWMHVCWLYHRGQLCGALPYHFHLHPLGFIVYHHQGEREVGTMGWATDLGPSGQNKEKAEGGRLARGGQESKLRMSISSVIVLCSAPLGLIMVFTQMAPCIFVA